MYAAPLYNGVVLNLNEPIPVWNGIIDFADNSGFLPESISLTAVAYAPVLGLSLDLPSVSLSAVASSVAVAVTCAAIDGAANAFDAAVGVQGEFIAEAINLAAAVYSPVLGLNLSSVSLSAVASSVAVAVTCAAIDGAVNAFNAALGVQGDFIAESVSLAAQAHDARSVISLAVAGCGLVAMVSGLAVGLSFPTITLTAVAVVANWSGRRSVLPPAYRLTKLIPHRKSVTRMTLLRDEVLDVGFDWQALLTAGETIVSSQWAGDALLNAGTEMQTDVLTSLWLTGANAANYGRYGYKNTITTSETRVLSTQLIITIR